MPNAIVFLQPAIPGCDPDRRYRGIGGNLEPFGMKLLEEEHLDVGVHDEGDALARAAEQVLETCRDRGPSNSQNQMPCHVPRTSLPPATRTSTLDPIIDAFTWEAVLPSPCR